MTHLIHITTIPVSLVALINHQIRYMQERGLEVSAISSPGEFADKFSETYRVPFHAVSMSRAITPLRDLVSLFQLWRYLKFQQPDIVHSHTPKAGLLGTIAAKLAGVPIRVYQIRGLRYLTTQGVKRRILMFTERLACMAATQVICNSHSNMEQVLADGLCSDKKIRVLLKGSGNGVDALKAFNPDTFSQAIRAEVRNCYDIPENAPVIGTIGRIVRDKGMVEMSAAWLALREEFPDLHWLIVGPFETEDPVPDDVRALLAYDPRIHLTGYVDAERIPAMLSVMEILAFPSYREGFPVTLLEAAAMRVPVVASNATGCRDAVEDGVTGTLIPVGNADALAAALRKYLENPDVRVEHGAAARERVLRDFQQERIWEAIYQTYMELLNKQDYRI